MSEIVNRESREITFNWTEIAPECPAVEYSILASNCGNCPTATNHTTATCTNVPANGGTCIFAIQIVICGYKITGQESMIRVLLDYKGMATYTSCMYIPLITLEFLAEHTVLYAVAGVLVTVTLTIFVVTLGVFFAIRFARAG